MGGFFAAVRLFEETGWNFIVAVAKLMALVMLSDRPEPADWESETRARFEHVGAAPRPRLLDATVRGQRPHEVPSGR